MRTYQLFSAQDRAWIEAVFYDSPGFEEETATLLRSITLSRHFRQSLKQFKTASEFYFRTLF